MEVGQGSSWSLPGGLPQGMLRWGCGSTAEAPWPLKRQVTGTGDVGFCSGTVLQHGLHLQQKLLSCPAGPCGVLGW